METHMKIVIALLVMMLAGCVSVDPDTGETLPRGNQKYKFATVEKRAEQLQVGMSKFNALILLGSPAEKSKDDNVWVYFPERPAVLMPSHALQLEFKDGVLVQHGYKAIVLGQKL
jgi:outer membrane protein assembly factor BamE (lipoprotein component of BamABCDE complex)